MPPIYIPNKDTKKWAGIFEGPFGGSLWKTFNIDLELVINKIVLSRRFKELQNSVTTTDLGIINKFISSTSDGALKYYALMRYGKLFKTTNSVPTGAYAVDASTGAPTRCYDAVNFEQYNGNDRLVLSVDGDIIIQNLNAQHAGVWKAGYWTQNGINGSTDATPIVIETTGNHNLETGDRAVVTNHLTNTNANGTWIVTKVDATHFSLNGSTATGAGAGSGGQCGYLNQPALSGYVSLDVFNRTLLVGNSNYLHTVDKNDKATYQRLTFPVNRKVVKIFHTPNRVWILAINTDNTKYGSVFEWDGFSQNYLYEHSINEIPITGCEHINDPFIITHQGAIMKGAPGQGFVEQKRFPVYEDLLKLVPLVQTLQSPISMLQYSMASNGREILFGFNQCDGYTGAVIQTNRLPAGIWAFNPINLNLYHKYSFSRYDGTTNYDYGQETLVDVGAILPINSDSDVIAGARYWRSYGSSALSAYGLFTATNRTSGRGHFITPLIPTASSEDIWAKVWTKFRKFIGSNNTIVIKARSSYGYNSSTSPAPITATGVWQTVRTFNSVVPSGVVAGDEVEILAGRSAGCTFHIASMSGTPNGSATITVTIDEDAPSWSSSSDPGILVRYDNFVKCGIIDYSSTDPNRTKLDIPLVNQTAPYLQLKVELRGPFSELDEMIVEHKSNQKID